MVAWQGLDATRNECEELIEQFDDNQSGRIGFADFSRGVRRMQRFLHFDDSEASGKANNTANESGKASNTANESGKASDAASEAKERARRPRKGSRPRPGDGQAASPALARRSSVAAFVDNLSREQLLEVERLFEEHGGERGFITHDELRAVVRAIDRRITPQGLDELVAQSDPGDSGRIAYDQFLKGVHFLFKAMKLRKQQRAQLRASDEPAGDAAADADKDRLIARLQRRVDKLEKKCREQKQEIDILRSMSASQNRKSQRKR